MVMEPLTRSRNWRESELKTSKYTSIAIVGIVSKQHFHLLRIFQTRVLNVANFVTSATTRFLISILIKSRTDLLYCSYVLYQCVSFFS